MSKLPLVEKQPYDGGTTPTIDDVDSGSSYTVGGDRKMRHKELTAYDPDQNLLVYDAELRELTMWDNFKLFFIPRLHFNPLFAACGGAYVCCFHIYDMKRSYLYVRQNSIESNVVAVPCCGLFGSDDSVSVTYFDREPFRRRGCCRTDYCVPKDQPSFANFTGGCLCCGYICCERSRVAMKPFDWMPCPLCCCENEVKRWQNCCDLCGPISGNPCVYASFAPQPLNSQQFVSVANETMGQNRGAHM